MLSYLALASLLAASFAAILVMVRRCMTADPSADGTMTAGSFLFSGDDEEVS